MMAMAVLGSATTIERWGCFEAALKSSKTYANPFTDAGLSARFECEGEAVTVNGFHDGDGTWKVRCMPTKEGRWTFKTQSPDPELDGQTGEFLCVPPAKGNHGPVRVAHTWHFAYADGTPYFQIGTTCYAWVHQTDELQEQTLKTLATAPFNKIRFCIFPKSYTYNRNDPPFYPFERRADGTFDFTRPNPVSWRHLERRILDLQRLGIEADLILWHPYDRWGFATMGKEHDDRYLRYGIARLAAFRNVWWSLANEYDLMAPGTKGHRGDKAMADWDRFFEILQKEDPFARLRSIHNCRGFYDHTRPWVTHASIQSSDLASGPDWRQKYRKPIVYDECKYEGNIPEGWGNLTAEQMVDRFWLGAVGGCYVGHGETYKHPQDILWWSKGGVLHGQSPARIAFLKRCMEPVPFHQMVPDAALCPGNATLAKPGELYLVYCLRSGPGTIDLPGDRPYKVDGIDTWNMTVAPLGTARPGKFTFTPPKAPYLFRFEPYKPGEALRPEAKAQATPTEGTPPLTVRFTGPADLMCQWDFGDGATSAEASPTHTYAKPGLYTATLTVTDKAGASATASLSIAVEAPSDKPLVRVGAKGGDSPPLKLHGDVKRGADGSLDFGDGEPWKWVSVGEKPLEALEGLRSFTLCGWLKATSLKIGSGGNRIAFNLNHARAGFDLVCLGDGRLRLAVNEWPDRVTNDSSPGKVAIGKWVFFAVAYDGTKERDNVRWYFGDADTPAQLDRTTTYARGATGQGSGVLTIGNYNETLHGNGLDRQFRGALRDIALFGSRIGSQCALSLGAVQKQQE